jgi:hypothetical protein
VSNAVEGLAVALAVAVAVAVARCPFYAVILERSEGSPYFVVAVAVASAFAVACFTPSS